MTGHVIKTFKDIGVKGCVARCIDYVDCKSFNIRFPDDDICELNNATVPEVKAASSNGIDKGAVVKNSDWDIMETDDNALNVRRYDYEQ